MYGGRLDPRSGGTSGLGPASVTVPLRRGVATAHCVTESRHARTSVRADQVYAGSTILARAGRALIDVHSTVLLPASVAPARGTCAYVCERRDRRVGRRVRACRSVLARARGALVDVHGAVLVPGAARIAVHTRACVAPYALRARRTVLTR